jgi:hypothetical protein
MCYLGNQAIKSLLIGASHLKTQKDYALYFLNPYGLGAYGSEQGSVMELYENGN